MRFDTKWNELIIFNDTNVNTKYDNAIYWKNYLYNY